MGKRTQFHKPFKKISETIKPDSVDGTCSRCPPCRYKKCVQTMYKRIAEKPKKMVEKNLQRSPVLVLNWVWTRRGGGLRGPGKGGCERRFEINSFFSVTHTLDRYITSLQQFTVNTSLPIFFIFNKIQPFKFRQTSVKVK